MLRLFLLFTVVPVLELYLLIQLGRATSAEVVVALVLLTGMAGAALAKHQGTGLLRRIHKDVSEGRLPAEGLLDGLLILVGGAFLITPGVLTDVAGLCMLVPWSRRVFKSAAKRWLQHKIETGAMRVHHSSDSRYDVDMDDVP